jgi:DNA modification methylase
MKKKYLQFLPLDTDRTVREQFGWLPSSVFVPEKQPHWDEIIKDKGDPRGNVKRGEGAKYLPALRYSKFHPHLAEIVVRYWSLPGELIVDPFAGRSCRGVVATHLDRCYEGYEVAPTTVDKLREDLPTAVIHNADGCSMNLTEDSSADLVFTCPPYHRLERYEDVEYQLSSVKNYDEFLRRIEDVGNSIYRVLKPERFLCWVCADWRDGKAFRIFHADTIDVMENAGLTIHDIVIVKNNSPFVHLQAGKVAAKRYTSKTHEYLLVFRKEAE